MEKNLRRKVFVHRYAFNREGKVLNEGIHQQVSGSEFQSGAE